MEIKHINRPLFIKEVGTDGLFSGYGSVFGKLDHHHEIVAPGAFARTLKAWRQKERMPAMLWMHDPEQPIGVWLDMKEDANGLAVTGRLVIRTQKGLEAHELMKAGAVTGLSIGYRVVSSRFDAKRKARILTDLDLFEVSLVTFPANEEARIGAVKAPIKKRAKGDSDATRAIVARLHETARLLQQPLSPQRRV